MYSIIPAKHGDHSHEIFISDNAFDNFQNYLKNLNKNNTVFVIDKIFLKKSFLKNFIRLNQDHIFFINGGIKSKNLVTAKKIIDFLNFKNFTRDSHIIAIGGGVVCDIVSFVASIYQRGINLILLPTTTTSMMDSCIGGKTGINYNNVVNLIGTYYQPKSIYVDLRFIETLSEIDYKSGIAESIKKGIILDKYLFEFLDQNYLNINLRRMDEIFNMINLSIDVKLRVTSSDTFEKSSRLLLNYGHTFGQSIESNFGIDQQKLTHGYAVALGMICASVMSENLFNNHINKIHKDILHKFGLPTKLPTISDKKIFLKKLMYNLKNDKKRIVNGTQFILAKEIGLGAIQLISDKKLIKKSFRSIF